MTEENRSLGGQSPFGVVPAEPPSARDVVDEMVNAGLLDHLMCRVDEGVG